MRARRGSDRAHAGETVDKPELLMTDPSTSVRLVIERYGEEPVLRALARCRALLSANPDDFTAAGAVRFLENVLRV